MPDKTPRPPLEETLRRIDAVLAEPTPEQRLDADMAAARADVVELLTARQASRKPVEPRFSPLARAIGWFRR